MPKYLDYEADRLARRVTFNLNGLDHDALVRIAKKQHVPFGQILRQLVRTYLKQVEK